MKVLPFIIPKTKNLGLIYQEDHGATFFDKFHQHEELQISYIVKGEGTLVVGDTVNTFKANDIIVIGSNQPHVFKSDTSLVKESLMFTLFFTKYSFGKTFFELEDFKEIRAFFDSTENSFKVLSKKNKLKKLFFKLSKSRDIVRFIVYIKIIDVILKSEIEQLTSFVSEKKYTDNEGKRMRAIMDFTLNNFNKKVTLDVIAEVANMTPNAFCRFFKQRTNKTYFAFLNQFRVEHACKLLRNKEYSILEVSEKSGFKNLSNFNRKFKALKKITPSTYRIKY